MSDDVTWHWSLSSRSSEEIEIMITARIPASVEIMITARIPASGEDIERLIQTLKRIIVLVEEVGK